MRSYISKFDRSIVGITQKALLLLASSMVFHSSPSFAGNNPVPLLDGSSPVQAVPGTTLAINVYGQGFVSGVVVLVSGVEVPTTYQSSTTVVAKIYTPVGSTGNLTLSARNPAPGGGTSGTFPLPIATLQITAKDQDGTNTGTARLGIPVNLTSADTDVVYTGRVWTLNGPGSLSWSGTNDMYAVYYPPQGMPADATVKITLSAYGLSSFNQTYTMTLKNPVPSVSSATPTQLLTGGTQTVTLSGSGFVPGMTVSFKGTSLPIDYWNYDKATVQVPVPNNATGSFKLQVQNPSPGGGSGTSFSESVAPNSIVLTANDGQGTNTGTAQLDSTVSMSAAVTGSVQTAVNWSVSGAGSVSSAGVYTPPATMPSNRAVTIHAALASNTAITASYSLEIVNPVPAIAGANPLFLPSGTTTSVSLWGQGFVPQTVITVNGTNMPTTYQSPTQVTAEISVPASETGNVSIRGVNPSPGGGTGDEYEQAISKGISWTAAARLLDQTTFGPTDTLISHVQGEGVTAWLNEQFVQTPTVLPIIPTTLPSYCGDATGCMQGEWWKAAITGNDQLRQRVAFALSEIFVVSRDTVPGWALQAYHNTLAADAFSNWFKIMNDVTLSPAMGAYLNMLNSAAPTGSLIANENFARENMQLFNLGLSLINQDGSLQLDGNGNPIPTYTQAQVQAFARAFTGWTFANANGSTPSQFNYTWKYYHPLVAVESEHDEGSKTLLNGTVLPAGQTAEQDMAEALTNVFQHPNVPPFVCQQLIQHLVKSNPSPEYISRVAQVFINDGNGVRGDMQAVLIAILTDPEARAGDTAPQASDGHLREPILWVSGVMRGLGFVNTDPNGFWNNISYSLTGPLNEIPYQSPAVFNFFPPSYVVPGTSLNAPEFSLENTANVTTLLTAANTMVMNSVGGFNVDLSATSPLGQILTKQGPTALVHELNQRFLHGTMDSSTAAAITSEIKTAPGTDAAQQVRLAVYLVITSTEYKILH